MFSSLKNPVSAALAVCTLSVSAVFAQTIDRYTYNRVFEQVKQSVVTIEVKKTIIIANTPKTVEGVGSGVIIDREGYVVTSKHVVEGASQVFIIWSGNQRAKASIVRETPPDVDIALIKLDSVPQDLALIKMGDSNKLLIGEPVLAVGSPLGLGGTLTAGVISAVRQLSFDPNNPPPPYALIQTDTAINPGNSGGALVNLDSELIGINTAIISDSGGSIGIGFAIPANVVKQIIADIKNKRITGWIGISVQDISETIAKTFKLDDTKGILTTAVVSGGPAQKAGLRQGDVIKSVDGKDVHNAQEFRWLERNLNVGQEITLGIQRGAGRVQMVKIIVGREEKTGKT